MCSYLLSPWHLLIDDTVPCIVPVAAFAKVGVTQTPQTSRRFSNNTTDVP